MKTVKLALKQNPYDIVIGKNILGQIGSRIKRLKIGKDAIIITHPVIERLYGAKISRSLKKSGFSVKVLTVPAGEKSKSAKCAMQLMEKIARYDIFKQVFVIALGGGVVGDLAGYVAAAYKRGVPYVQVPTSFLAQIDSAIGGKVAIDLPIGKNLVGAFYQPKMVYSDVNVLKTLDKRQIRNGLAEAIKYGVIYDAKLFSFIEKNAKKLANGNIECLYHIVKESSRIKAEVVLKDERETKSIRTILNFGHTVGHAIEAAGGYSKYHHGESIALGMRIASEISLHLRKWNDQDDKRLNDLISAVGLPKKVSGLANAKILKIMRHDKKFITGKNRFVLADRIGKVSVVEGIDLNLINSSINRYKT